MTPTGKPDSPRRLQLPLTLRRALAATALLALGLSGCQRQQHDGLTVVILQADWYPQPEHGGFYTALNKGYYRAEGLDVQIRPSSPYANADALVASGIAQFGMNSSDHVLQAVANAHEPLVAVGAQMQHDPQGIMLHADSPVRTWSDLDGQAIAVRPGSTWWDFLVAKFHLTHVREMPVTYSVASFLHDPAYIQQAFVTSEPYFAERAGAKTRMLLNRDAGFDPYRVYFTSQQFAAEHPEIVRKFVHATTRGWQEYMQDPRETNALLLRLNPALSPDWERFSWEHLRDGHFVTGDPARGEATGTFTAERWQQMYDQLVALKLIHQPIDPKSAFTTEFFQASSASAPAAGNPGSTVRRP